MVTSHIDQAALAAAVAQMVPPALLVVAEDAVQIAKGLAPVATGALRDSIHAEPDGEQVVVGASVDYAAAVEFGTSRTEAQHFLVPALYEAAKKHG